MNIEKNYTVNETKDVESFFHGYAADFDSIYGHTKKRSSWDRFLDHFFRKSMRLRYDLVLKYASNPEIRTILDIGCGGGVYCEALLQKGKSVTGLDIAEGMLELAKQKTKPFFEKGQVRYIHSGYIEHSFTEQFDAAILVGFFDYIKNPADVIAKLGKDITKEVLMSFPKSGGILAWQRKIRYRMRNCPLYYYSKSDLVRLFDAAGWGDKIEILDIERDFFVRARL
jgi:SAM-dependent methyltransferase